jgi:hypothetical protein
LISQKGKIFLLLPPAGQNLFINILKKLAKKTSIGDDTPKERHLADREAAGVADPFLKKPLPLDPV